MLNLASFERRARLGELSNEDCTRAMGRISRLIELNLAKRLNNEKAAAKIAEIAKEAGEINDRLEKLHGFAVAPVHFVSGVEMAHPEGVAQ